MVFTDAIIVASRFCLKKSHPCMGQFMTSLTKIQSPCAEDLVVSSVRLPLTSTSFAVLSAACFGISIVITKLIVETVDPILLLTIQSLASTLFLWSVVLLQKIPVPLKLSSLKAGAIGFLEPGLSCIFGILGLSLTTASNVALLDTIEPILTIALAYLILREPLSKSLLSWSGVACIGVGLIAIPDFAEMSQTALQGDGLIFLSLICAAFYAIATRRIVNDFHPVVLAALQQTFALLWFLFVLAIVSKDIAWASLNTQTILLAIVSGILGYAMAFWLYLMALKQQTASMTALYLTLIPVFGVMAAYFFLQERLLPIQALGGLLILFVVFKISKLPKLELSELQRL